jgi:hypothetical protein
VQARCFLSSNGDGELDGSLPFAERYEVPEEIMRAVAAARRFGKGTALSGRSEAPGDELETARELARAIVRGGR